MPLTLVQCQSCQVGRGPLLPKVFPLPGRGASCWWRGPRPRPHQALPDGSTDRIDSTAFRSCLLASFKKVSSLQVRLVASK